VPGHIGSAAEVLAPCLVRQGQDIASSVRQGQDVASLVRLEHFLQEAFPSLVDHLKRMAVLEGTEEAGPSMASLRHWQPFQIN